jgi:hypothetical protein
MAADHPTTSLNYPNHAAASLRNVHLIHEDGTASGLYCGSGLMVCTNSADGRTRFPVTITSLPGRRAAGGRPQGRP